MPTSDEYRKVAEEYYRLAREAKTETDRLKTAPRGQERGSVAALLLHEVGTPKNIVIYPK